jgi:hypothetical protein
MLDSSRIYLESNEKFGILGIRELAKDVGFESAHRVLARVIFSTGS